MLLANLICYCIIAAIAALVAIIAVAVAAFHRFKRASQGADNDESWKEQGHGVVGLSLSMGEDALNILPAQFPIPKLATDAVIPPNNEFLAILGDQRSGRNIETPEGLMRDIFRQELAQLSLPAPTVQLNAQSSIGELVRLLFPHIEQERERIGTSLVSGVR